MIPSQLGVRQGSRRKPRMGRKGRVGDIRNPFHAWDFGREKTHYVQSALNFSGKHPNPYHISEPPNILASDLWVGATDPHGTTRNVVLQALSSYENIDAGTWCLHGSRRSSVAGSEEPLAKKFARLVRQWREETAGFSSPTMIASNRAYLSMIALGRPSIPLMLKELRDNGGFWYPALRAVTDDNPVPASARGKTRLMKKAWLQWGRQYELLD